MLFYCSESALEVGKADTLSSIIPFELDKADTHSSESAIELLRPIFLAPKVPNMNVKTDVR